MKIFQNLKYWKKLKNWKISKIEKRLYVHLLEVLQSAANLKRNTSGVLYENWWYKINKILKVARKQRTM